MRTLRDFETEKYILSPSRKEKWITEDLRRETKKWLTYLQSGGSNGLETQELSHSRGNIVTAEEWIKHFFNLEDEDGM